MPRTRPSAQPEPSAQRRPSHHRIDPADEFRRHAAECQRMAKITRDRASKESWHRLAERWTQVAERFLHDRESVHRPPPRYRKPPPGWATQH